MNNSENMVVPSNNTNEGCLYVALVVTGIGALAFSFMGEWLLLAGGILAALVIIVLLLSGLAKFVAWILNFYTDLTIKRQTANAEIERINAETQSMLIRNQAETQSILAKSQIVHADSNGQYPIAISQLDQLAHAQLQLAAHMHDTRRTFAPVPNSIHYSVKNEGLAPQMNQLSKVTVIPTFGELMASGRFPKDKLLLGFDEEQKPIEANFTQMYSTLIGGQSGSGKSTLVRSLLAQAALQDSKFVVIDPHFNAGEESLGSSLMPLRSHMVMDIASTEGEMREALNFVLEIGKRRLLGDSDKSTLVLVVDETTALLQRSNIKDLLQEVLGQITQETRKVHVYAICIGQNFHSDIIDTTVRNSFCSFVSCRARKEVARMQSGDSGFAQAASTLVTGQAAYLSGNGELQVLSVPNCTARDIELVAGRDFSPIEALPKALPTVNDTNEEESGSAPEAPWKRSGSGLEAQEITSTDYKIRELFSDGHSTKSIIKQVFNCNGGRNYETYVQTVDNAIRKFIQ